MSITDAITSAAATGFLTGNKVNPTTGEADKNEKLVAIISSGSEDEAADGWEAEKEQHLKSKAKRAMKLD